METRNTGRRPHYGTRLAGQVIAMLFRGGIRTAVIGLTLGLIPAWGIARLMQSFIWGVRAGDMAAFLGVPLVLMAGSTIAISVPAVPATRIDPVRALRDE